MIVQKLKGILHKHGKQQEIWSEAELNALEHYKARQN